MAADPSKLSNSLETATQEKLRKYKELLGSKSAEEANCPFWDVVVVTAGDEDQKSSFQRQIELKKERGEIPTWVEYMVFCDPPGAKIGCGGATMHALEQLQLSMPEEQLEKAKVMLVHAGGYSQRLPSLSVLGKIFLTLPCGDPIFQMFEAVLWMYIDFPARMKPGIYLIPSDIIFLFNGAGEWNFSEPGFTAIGHPSSLEIARTHGVYVLDDVKATREKYLKDPSHPTMMSGVKRFLHKMTADKLRENGAIVPDIDEVYVDLAYYMDYGTARKLTKFYSEHKPLTCEIDAYGDFLQALGPDATDEYCRNVANVTEVADDLVTMRTKVFQLLKGVALNVVIFHEAQFDHVGTTAEYLDHMCYNETLIRSCRFETETMVKCVESSTNGCEGEPNPKRVKPSNYAIMYSVLHNHNSISVSAGSVVEYCTLEEGVEVEGNCIISNLHVPANTKIPNSSFLHTVAVEIDGKIQYATFAFGDSMKTKQPRDNAGNLGYCQLKMELALEKLGLSPGDIERVWPAEISECSLWTARLFPVYASRLESSKYALDMIRSLKGLQEPLGKVTSDSPLLSVADMLKLKSTTALLEYHSELRIKIISK